MLICVHGEDGFRVGRKITQLKEEFKRKFDSVGINVSKFDLKNSFGEIVSAIRSRGLLSQKRMVVLSGFLSSIKTADVEQWSSVLCGTDSDSIVVLRDEIDADELKKKPLWLAIRGAKDFHEYAFEKLSPLDLERWVVYELGEMNSKISRDALRNIIANTGGDTWLLYQEMLKLAAYSNGRIISADDVHKLVKAIFEDDIFAFVDAVSKKQIAEAVNLLMRERESGDSDGYLFSMLLRQVRLLLGARSLLDQNPQIGKDEVAKELGVHPFVAQKALEQARRYSLTNLVKVHDLMFEFDQKIKSGEDAGLAVERVAIQMMN
jgi:DNA polymerase-3 subunit delta